MMRPLPYLASCFLFILLFPLPASLLSSYPLTRFLLSVLSTCTLTVLSSPCVILFPLLFPLRPPCSFLTLPPRLPLLSLCHSVVPLHLIFTILVSPSFFLNASLLSLCHSILHLNLLLVHLVSSSFYYLDALVFFQWQFGSVIVFGGRMLGWV